MVAIVGGNSFGLLNGSAGVLGQNGLFGNALFGTAKEKAFLNVSTGNLTLQDADGFVTNTGVDIALTRTYNSQGNLASGFGHHWTDGLAKLSGLPADPDSNPNLAGTTISRTAADGSVALFTYDAARGAYSSTDGGGAYQTVRYDKTLKQWIWSGERDDMNGVNERYDVSGNLVATADKAGVRIQYTYDASGRLSTIVNGTESTSFTYTSNADGGTTIGVTQALSDGTTTIRTSYTLDARGRLTSVQTAGVGNGYAVSYGYDGDSDRIRTVSQSDGSVLTVSYDAEGRVGELVEHDNSGTPDRSTRLSYALNPDGQSLTTTVTDALGHQTIYVSNAQGQLASVTTPVAGNTPIVLTYGYNARGDVTSVSDGGGRVSTYEYDEHGNRVVEHHADGSTITRTFATYDPTKPALRFGNQMLTESVVMAADPDGSGPLKGAALTTRYVLNSLGQLRYVITPEGRVTEYVRNADGQVINEWTYTAGTFDVSGLQANQVPAELDVQGWSRGAVGNAPVVRTDYAYTRGRLTSSTKYTSSLAASPWPGGATTTVYTYDLAGNILSAKDPNGNTTTYTYDAFGRPLTQTDPTGISLFTYVDGAASVTTTDPSGVKTLRVYDSNGRLLSTTASAGSLTLVTRNVYDAAGRLRMSIDQAGRKTVWLYDDAGRMIAEIGPDGAMTEYVYQAGSNVQPWREYKYATRLPINALFSSDGNLLDSVTLETLKLLVSTDLGNRRVITRYYDPAGRILAEIDSYGYVTRNEYDAAGRLIKTIMRDQPRPVLAIGAYRPNFDLDTPSPNDHVTEYGYNADGQIAFKIDPLKNRTDYVYNGAGLLTDTIASSKDGSTTIREHFLYDGLGRMIASVDGDNYVTELMYDGNSNVVRRIRWGTASIDPTASTLDALKRNIPTNGGDGTFATSYTYSATNKVLTEATTSWLGGSYGGSVVTYTYDKFDNVKTVTKTAGIAAQYDYDDLGRLISETPWAGAKPIKYAYDSQGRKVSTTDQNGNRTLFFYDVAGRLAYTVNALGEVTERTYDTFGELASEHRYGALIDKATLSQLSGGDAANMPRLTSAMTDSRNYYYYDRDGRLTYTVNGAGEAALQTYNAFGQVASTQCYTARLSENTTAALTGGLPQTVLTNALQGVAVQATRYAYDNDGHLVYTINADDSAESRKYDDFGRVTEIRQHALTNHDAPVASSDDTVVTMGYDKRGNVVRYTDASGTAITTYNAHNLTTSVERSGNFVAASATGTGAASQTAIERTFYDGELRVSATIDAAGTVTTFKYDANNNVTERKIYTTPITPENAQKATADNIPVTSNPAKDSVERYIYDAAGRVIMVAAVVVPNTNIWSLQTRAYNDAGDLVEQRAYATPMATVGWSAISESNIRNWIANNTVARDPRAATDAIQRMVYDGAGRLIATATRQSDLKWAIVTRKYDSNGRVIQQTAYGKPLELMAPTDADILAMQPSSADAITAYQYDQAGRVVKTATAQRVEGTEPNLGPVHWALVKNDYNALGQLERRTQYANEVITATRLVDFNAAIVTSTDDRTDRYVYDQAGRVSATIDAMGAVVGMVYDAKGNLLRRTAYVNPSANGGLPAANALDRVTRYVYNENNQAVYEIDPAGAVTAREYDAMGNVSKLTRYATPLAGTLPANLSVSSMRSLVTATSADRTDVYYYDASGRQRFAIDPAGYLTEIRYDGAGRTMATLVYQTSVAGGLSLADLIAAAAQQTGSTAPPRSTAYTYDSTGNLLTMTDALGHTETYTYDGRGNRVTLTKKPVASKPDTITWTYKYDAAGHMVEEITPQIDVYTVTDTEPYLGWGNLTPDRPTLSTKYTYDTLGNLTSRSEGITGAATARVTSYAYDLVGRQTVTKLPETMVYDATADNASHSAVAEKQASALTVEVTYDVFGDAVMNKDVGGKLSYKFYDRRGQVVRDVDAQMYATDYQHNVFGEVESLTRYAVALANPVASAHPSADDRTIRTQYDLRGLAVKVIEPMVAINDNYMLPDADQHSAARTTENSYNAYGELIQRDIYGADRDGKALTAAASTYYYYDQRGGQRAQIDVADYKDGAPQAYLTTFDYDYAARVTARTEFGHAVSGWSKTDWAWGPNSVAVTADWTADRSTTTTYDAMGNKTRERLTGTSTEIITGYDYDDLGRLRSTTDGKGVKTFTYYDNLGRVTGTAMIEPGTKADQSMPMSAFRLDAFGNVVLRIDYSSSVPDGSDGMTRPSVTYVKGTDRVTINRYDDQGHLKTTIDAEGHPTYFSYDVYGRVAKQWRIVNDKTADAQTAFQIQTYDALGQLKEVTQTGNYDALNKAAGADTIQHYDYNAFGEVTASKVYSGATLLRTEETRYDNAGRAWLTNAGDGVYRATLYDARGNATASFVSELTGNDGLQSLNSAVEVLGRANVRRVDTRYDLLGHVVDVSQSYAPNQFFLSRETSDYSWIRVPYDPAKPTVDGLLVVGDRGDASSSFDVRYRIKGTNEWLMAGQRVQWVDGYAVFNTGALAAGTYEVSVFVQPTSGAGFQLDTIELNIATKPSEQKIAKLIELYLALQGRMPDPDGLDYWLGRLNEGSTLAQIAGEMVTNKDTTVITGQTTASIIKTVLTGMLGYTLGTPEYDAALKKWSLMYDEQSFERTDHGQVLVDLVDYAFEKIPVFSNRVRVAQAYLIAGGNNVGKAAALLQAAATNVDAALATAAIDAANDKKEMQLARLYLTLLGRAPDPSGFQAYMDGLKGAQTVEMTAQHILDSTEFATILSESGLTPAQYNDQFIRHVYGGLVGRMPTTAEMESARTELGKGTKAAWLVKLIDSVTSYAGTNAGAIADRRTAFAKMAISLAYANMMMDGVDVATQVEIARTLISGSAPDSKVGIAAEQVKQKLQAQILAKNAYGNAASLAANGRPLEAMQLRLAQLYTAVLGRAPDQTGYDFWLNGLVTGTSAAHVVDVMLAEEGGALNGTSDADFIRGVYQNAFGSAISQGALDFWTAEVGRQGRGQTVVDLIDSMIAGDDPALKTQRDMFNNRVAVGMTYVLYMNGNDLPTARSLFAMVTATDTSAAIAAAYKASDALLAQAAAETAAAAESASKLLADAAEGARKLSANNLALADAQALVAANPMATYVLRAARLYVGLLNRGTGGANPLLDVTGLIKLAVDLTTKTDATMAAFMLTSDEGVRLYPASLTNREFVTQVYAQVMHIAPTPAISDAWVQKLDSGRNRADVAVDILNAFADQSLDNSDPLKVDSLKGLVAFQGQVASALSAIAEQARQSGLAATTAKEAALNAQQAAKDFETAKAARTQAISQAAGTNAETLLKLVQLYVGVLNRPAVGGQLDYTGVTFWLKALVNGPDTPATVAQAMIDDPANNGLYASATTPELFIKQIYRQVHNRDPDPGADMWINELKSGVKTRGQVAWDIIDSVTNRTYAAASEYSTAAAFEQRVRDAAYSYSSASTTQIAIANASTDLQKAFDTRTLANQAVIDTLKAWNDAKNAVATSDPGVQAAQAAIDFLNSPYHDSLHELLVAFNKTTSYSSVALQLKNLEAGITSLAKIAGAGRTLTNKTSFFTSLYKTILKRDPDPEGLEWWVTNTTSTDPNFVAYDFYLGALDELYYGNELSVRNDFSYKVVMAISANDKQAQPIADSYATRLRDAQGLIDLRRIQTKRAYDDAVKAAPLAETNYQDLLKTNTIALSEPAALTALLSIQDKAIAADRAGATSYAAMDASNSAAEKMLAGASSWTLDKIIQTSPTIANAGAAASPDAALSKALADVAGANLALVLNNKDIAGVSAATRNMTQVVQLYMVLYGPGQGTEPKPSLVQLNSAMKQLNDGVTLSALADTLISRDPTLNAKNDTEFLDLMYWNANQRAVDAGGREFWTKALAGPPKMTHGALAAGLINSLVIGTLNNDTAMFNGRVSTSLNTISLAAATLAKNPNTQQIINGLADAMRDTRTRADATAQADLTPEARYAIELTQLYVTLLDRTPEPSALLAAIDLRRQGVPLEFIANSILASDEIQGKLPQTADNQTFITALFTQALRRPPTAAESTDLLGKLGNGQLTRASLVTKVIKDTYDYSGGEPAVLGGRELLIAKVDTALAEGADALQNYLAAVSAPAFSTNLAKALQDATLRYVDGYRTVMDSTTSSAPVVHTTPDHLTVDRWGNTLSYADQRNPNLVTRYTYNALNQVLETTYPATSGGVLKQVNEYDALGHLTSTAEVAVDGNISHATTYQYDDKGALIKETHADGGHTDYTTDAFGQRKTSTQYLSDNQTVAYSYEYDRVGNLVKRTSAPVMVYDWYGYGSAKSATGTSRSVVDAFTYDELGHRTSTKNYTTDSTGTPQYGLVTTNTSVYDVGGNIIKSTDANYLTTYRAYDALNNKIAERESYDERLGSTVGLKQSWTYDGYGRVLTHTDLGGNLTTNEYNGAGQLAKTTRATTGQFGSVFQTTTYSYEGGTGYLLKVEDRNFVNNQWLEQVARYSYDRLGNRITEQTWIKTDSGELRLLQDNVLSYDARNQLTDITSSVPGADYHVEYTYDAFGNRKRVKTVFTNDVGDKKTIDVAYDYDTMNRVANITGSVNTTYGNPILIRPRYYNNPKMSEYYEQLDDDVVEEWKYFDNKAIDSHSIGYDWAGNRTRDNDENYSYDALGRLSSITKNGSETGYRRYDSVGRVIESRDADEVQLNDYDAGGRIIVQRSQANSDQTQHSVVQYTYNGELGFLESYKAQGASNAKWQTTTNTYNDLKDTRLLTSTTVRNDGDTSYKYNTMVYDLAGNMSGVTANDYKNGQWTIDNANSRTMISDYAGHVLEKTQNGLVTHTLMANDQMIGYSSAAYESFSSVHEGLSSATKADVSVYVVQSATETLKSIAKGVWGDERLWYVIADANGLTMSDAPLTVGQSLQIPAQVGSTYNGADTFKPYNAAEIIGNTTPEMALPVPQQHGGGCGALGQLVMVVVAVVATIYTAGAAAQFIGAASGAIGGLGASVSAGLGAIGSGAWTAGLGVMAGTSGLTAAGAVAAGAIGGAMGSIASQTVGMAIGAQDGFSWKGVALSAIGGGVSAGVGSLAEKGILSTSFSGTGWKAAAARAALSNTVTQRVGMITGLQDSFQWRNVAASAAGAAAGAKVTEYLNGSSDVASLFKGHDLAKATASGFVAGTTTAIARGGKIEITRIAVDAFGNALGSSLAYGASPASDGASSSPTESRSVSPHALGKVMNGSLTGSQLFGGDEDWLGALGTYNGPLGSDTQAVAPALTFAEDHAQRTAENSFPFTAPIPQVVVNAHMTPEERLTAKFGLLPVSLGPQQVAQSTELDAGALARRFGSGLWHGAVDMVWQPVANTIDLGQVVVGLASGGRYEPSWLSSIGRNYNAGMSYGETVTRSVLGSNPVTGVGLATYDLTSSALRRDWGGVAEGAGGLLGGFATGKLGQRWAAPQVGAELGVIRVRSGNNTVSGIDGFTDLPGSQAANFNGVPRPVPIGDAPLYRIFDTVDPSVRGAQPNGAYWSRSPYQNESAWRSGAAVQEDWNSGIYQGEWTPEPQYAWGGRAAPQAIEGSSASRWGFKFGWINKGGDYQLYIPNSRSVIQPSVVIARPAPWRK